MTHYRSLIGASLLALAATAPAFAQQGAPGGSLYNDPQSRSYVAPSDKQPADAARNASAPAPTGAAAKTPAVRGPGASPPDSSGLIGPRFGGG